MTSHGATRTAPSQVEDLHTERFEHLRAVFDSVDATSGDSELMERVAEEFPGPDDDPRAVILAFRDLLRVEERPERFRRLLRAWSSKVVAAVRKGDFPVAGVWMRAVTEAPVFPAEFIVHVNDALRDLSRSDILDELVTLLSKSERPDEAAALLSAWGEPLVQYLIDAMTLDEPPVNRRHLVEYLTMVGRSDVRYITPWLRDHRWFIVRNVAIAVGNTGRESGVPALMAVLDHPDDRVRVEVIRALATLEGEEAVPMLSKALADPSQRVRNGALSLLRSIPTDEVVLRVADHLATGRATPDDARRLVKVIAERSTPAATEALHRMAGKRFAVGAEKVARDHARLALERRR
ncbi:MAG: HEAT repeat domain-containing protein [Acidimicrobiia bacterium]|nr:MAG: HEAT repeat domain-containing protein [Acidimicrobiia bacterium]